MTGLIKYIMTGLWLCYLKTFTLYLTNLRANIPNDRDPSLQETKANTVQSDSNFDFLKENRERRSRGEYQI
jgi:hypothetical protein